MSWSVGKTMVGQDGIEASSTGLSEMQARQELATLMKTEIQKYETVMAKSDPHGWYGPLMKLRWLVSNLDDGKWPVSSHGLNWFWSIPWGPELEAERDLWVFWVRHDGGNHCSEQGVAA